VFGSGRFLLSAAYLRLAHRAPNRLPVPAMPEIGTGHYSIRSQQINLFVGAVGPVVNTLTPIETLSAENEPSQVVRHS
jgi:hypothetical protein